MAVEKVPDPYSLIQQNWPADSEEKFATSAASLTASATHHNVRADAYRTAIAGLSDEVFQGKLADASRDEFGKIASRHEEEEQYLQKLAESISQCGMQILMCKNEINSTCAAATTKIGNLETQKSVALNQTDQQRIQKSIDQAKKTARDNIANLHDQLEHSLTTAAASMKALHDQIEMSGMKVEGKTQPAAREAHATPVEAAARESHADVPGADPASAAGAGAPAAGNAGTGSGTEGLSNGATPVSPAAMMGGGMPQQMPQAPQMPQMPSGMPGGAPGGGMGSQLPGQELASKAMDMAQNAGGKDNTFLSDSSVKDLLAASGDHGGAGHGGAGGEGHGGESGSGGGNSAAGGAGGGAVPVSASNPTAASGPSPATPVSSARPTGGPSVAMTELAGAPTSGPVSGLSSAAAGVSGLTGAPVTQVAPAAGSLGSAAVNAAAGSAGGAGFGAPVGYTPTAGSVGVPSTVGGGFGAPVPAPSAPAPVAPAVPAAPSSPVVPATPPPAPSVPAAVPPAAPVVAVPPPVAPPPTVAGFNPVPASMGSAPVGLLDVFGPPATVAVMAAPPQLESLPPEQRITILNTASIVTQMRGTGWVASVATALLNDGENVAVVIATGDDLSILPPDTTIPKASILLHHFNLGERFRSQWAGCADTVTKLIAGVDAHPLLDRSMIKHVSAFTRNSEIPVPPVPFTPISMDAAWAIRYLYTPPQETVPAYTGLQSETFTEAQISYLLSAAERKWQLPTKRLSREGQARLESASMFASRWSKTGEAQLREAPRGYDARIAGYLWAATREAFRAGDLERASWYGQYLRYQTLPASKLTAA